MTDRVLILAHNRRYEWLRRHFIFAEDSMRELWFDHDNVNTEESAKELDRAIDQCMADWHPDSPASGEAGK
jgi:hypothetical protein